MTQGQQGLRSNCGNHHEDNKGDNQIHRADNDFLNHCQQFTSILTEFSSESKIVNDAEASELITIGELDDFYEQIENAWWQSLEQRIEVLEGYARLFRQAQNKIDMWSKTLGEEQGSLTRSSATSSVDLISHHLAITKLQIIASELDIIYLKSLNAEHVPEASSTTSHPNSMGNLKALFTDLPAVIKHSIHMDFSVPYEEQFGNLKNALSAQIKSRFLAVEDLMTKLSSMNVLQTELIEYDLMLSHLVVQFFENEACLRVPLPATLPDLDIGSAQVDHDHNRSIKFEQSVHKTLLLRQLESEGLESLLAVM
ncbi:protein of unknown function [Taphrina deformans PYCC 5710]|uniref:Uncharacterized protein n=1 Tax=Taphrina deformans (strain PYCC 5710 / ATCC 11124 / CBS 356.35 / IMI 108563 / JCM 9778 / NBRC 8474) TaxID=1097556 RepID=R4XG94_TAPDE|nr:protein of unknown function [Taphrina deformans PYCC 5710]|eukprot:CCG84775.1 protein of unknown function [Taphrina deformans PYCC 5710]